MACIIFLQKKQIMYKKKIVFIAFWPISLLDLASYIIKAEHTQIAKQAVKNKTHEDKNNPRKQQ